MAGESSAVSVVEALIALLVTIGVLLIVEITMGAAFDQMAFVFSGIVVPGADLEFIGTVLGYFKQIHYIMGIMIVMTCVWVVRVVIFGADYTRYRKGGML